LTRGRTAQCTHKMAEFLYRNADSNFWLNSQSLSHIPTEVYGTTCRKSEIQLSQTSKDSNQTY